ncbi:MAG TPA: T9SS type A sorting domain-containing protein [bacterium]|nr:T9SS type A sorting domain-containing protein [bacterium]
MMWWRGNFQGAFGLFLVVVFSFFRLAAQPLEQFSADIHTIGLWHFNETQGDTAFDASGNNLHGLLQNGVQWNCSGKFGSCLDFNGEGRKVVVSNTALFHQINELTIDAWVYLSPTNDNSAIVSRWNTIDGNPKGQFLFAIHPNTTLTFFAAFQDRLHSIQYSVYDIVDRWALVSAVFSNGLMGIFVDGEQVAEGQSEFSSLTPGSFFNDDLYIGNLWTDEYYPYAFDGKIDEVRISNVSRYSLSTAKDREQCTAPEDFFLQQNFPNPFNSHTIIEYRLAEPGRPVLEIFNIAGQKINQLSAPFQLAGRGQLRWDGRDAAGNPVVSGIYWYRMTSGKLSQQQRMVLLR